MSTTDHKRRHHGPVIGDPALRSAPPAGSGRAMHGRRRPGVMMLGCLSTYDYLCHDYTCRGWANCPHGGNRD